MSKKFRSQASSARAADSSLGFGPFQTNSSPLSYIAEQPNLSGISEPNIVVAFKNLGKKDSTTKAKALEEIHDLYSSGQIIEDAVLQAWSSIYPRTAIDNSRRVRQLAHNLQGLLTTQSGKRIVPQLPNLIGPWLAGTKDNDKIVSRSAQEALERSFNTPEKRNSLWKIYKDSLLEYVEDSVTTQTKATLSDERTTSPDDAKAKYVRVVGTAINLLDQLLREGYGEHLLSVKIWQLAYYSDAYVRRAVCRLALVAKDLDWTVISTCFLSKALHCDQTGSCTQYVQTLIHLTQQRPELWSSDYTGKTSVTKRLDQFLRRGSQNGTAETWSTISLLLRIIPEAVYSDLNGVIESLRIGVVSDRVNARVAWMAYVEVAMYLSDKSNGRQDYIEEHIIPVIVQCITKKGSDWTSDIRISQKIVSLLDQALLEHVTRDMINSTITLMKLSLPETSKDFSNSQDAVIAQAERLFQILVTPSEEMLIAAMDLLKSRNGKPYCAAEILEILVRQKDFDRNNTTLQSFLDTDLLTMLESPSATRLVRVAIACGNHNMAQELLDHERALCAYLSYTDRLEPVIQAEVQNRLASTEICTAIMMNPGLKDLQHRVLEEIGHGLSTKDVDESGTDGLLLLDQMLSNVNIAREIADSKEHSSLMSRLLVLADAGNMKALELLQKLNTKSSTTGLQILQRQLDGERPHLSTSTLISLAQESRDSSILPTADQWKAALIPHLNLKTPVSLTITSQLQGVIYSINDTHLDSKEPQTKADMSQIMRLVLYVTGLDLSLIVDKTATHMYLPVALQLVNEKLTVGNANELWTTSTPEIVQDAMEALESGNSLMISWLDDDSFIAYWMPLLHNIGDYSSALAWTNIITEYVDRQGSTRVLEEYADELSKLYSSKNLIQSGALIAVAREYLPSSNLGRKLCNELVAGATDGNRDHIILLNILLQGQPTTLENLPNQRIVFLMISLIKNLSEIHLRAENMKLLSAILPIVASIYGQYWEDILSSLKELWSTKLELTVLNASLKLFARLRQLIVQDENEDLRDAWSSAKSTLEEHLVRQLSSLDSQLEIDQPRAITADLLRRQLVGVDLQYDAGIYKHLASRVEIIQTTAYEMLHRTIPQHQAQLSIEVVLEGKDVHLPEQLLELGAQYSTTRQYLLAWRLVFDHFSSASFRLKESYVEDVKKSGHLDELLNHICEELRITDRAVDASKFDFQNFVPESERELVWLTINLYYNCLLHLPGLVREWHISQKNHIKIPLEAWTRKYISPSIITTSLNSVSDWAKAQEGEEHLDVKPSPKASELIASITIDEENSPISLAVSLPSSYPLESPSVISRTRVGVSEKNWISWLRTFQIIIFSTGSIIEGLIAFRRNVQGALKGQTECAICYSIIGTDMQTPNKKCGTCKNTFHGACLFRWFKSSNSSSCPLCRNNFNYA